MGRGGGSDRGVDMNDGVDWLIGTEGGGGSLCIDGLVLLLSVSNVFVAESCESTWSRLDVDPNS